MPEGRSYDVVSQQANLRLSSSFCVAAELRCWFIIFLCLAYRSLAAALAVVFAVGLLVVDSALLFSVLVGEIADC